MVGAEEGAGVDVEGEVGQGDGDGVVVAGGVGGGVEELQPVGGV